MITPGDEYPLHLSSRPVRDPGTDRNLYDRFFFNGYPQSPATSGVQFFAAAFGTYPGRNVVDAAFSVIVDGVQHNVRGSRIMGDDRLDLRCGPVTVTIVEPLRQLRLSVDSPESGISADLLFTARGPHFEEPHYRWTPGHRTLMDITRMTQNGTWSGSITVGGVITPIDAQQWWGGRDRSWGIRGVGQREEPGSPDSLWSPGFYWLWAPMNLQDEVVLFDVNEYPDGSRWHQNASIAPAGGTVTETKHGLHTYDIDWKPGTRHASAFTVDMVFPGGLSRQYKLQGELTFYMQGIGYGHSQWGHGMWVGPNERSYDSIELDSVNEADPLFQHVQILSTITRNDGAPGMGILEMLLIGPHQPSGFQEALDMHA